LSLDGQRRFLTIRIKSKDRLSLTRRITTIDRLFSINPRALPASSPFAATASSQRRRLTRFAARVVSGVPLAKIIHASPRELFDQRRF
jgi:hypothetical protein